MTNFYAKSIKGELVFDNKKEIKDFLEKQEGKSFVVNLKREKGIRTDTQNNSIHLYFNQVSNALNEAGYTVQLALKERIDLNFTPELVKELIWRPAQKVIVEKASTTQLDKVSDIGEIYETVNRHLGERFGLHIPFPSDPNKIPN